MTPDWKALSDRASALRTLQTVLEPKGKDVNRVLFAGLYVKLSEITGLLTAAGAATVTIFADTVVGDAPALAARGLVVVCRSFDASPLNGAPLQLGLANKDSIAQFLVQSFSGGELKVRGVSGQDVFSVPSGQPFQSALYRFSAAGSSAVTVHGGQGDLEDLFGRIWALNSMKASFAAAAHLMAGHSPSDRGLARLMLRWIVAAIGALSTPVSSDYSELYGKAAALLVELNIAPGAYYLPVLAKDFYQKQVVTLLDALSAYEDNLGKLDTKSDLAKTVAEVGKALQTVAGGEAVPLREHLKNVERNVTTLRSDIRTLSKQVILQQIETETSFQVMVATIGSEKILDFVKGVFKVLGSAVKAGVAFTKADASIGDGLGALLDMVQQGKKAYDDINMQMPNNQLVKRSGELLEMQKQLMLAYAAGETLFLQPGGQTTGAKLPEGLAVEAVDPNLAWNNYIVSAESEMTSLKENLGAESSSLESINRYLANVKILAQYGKAIDAKYVACSSQMAAVPMIRSQIQAAENAENRWKELSAKAQTDEERIAILKAVVQARIDTIKRAIFAAWRNFRNSYFYLYFREPSSSVDLEMNGAAMKAVFGKLTDDIAEIYLDPDAGEKVPIPSDDVGLEFHFHVVRSGEPLPETGAVALFTPAGEGTKATLTWTFEHGGDIFLNKLPNADQIAVWVTQAEFFLDGIQANSEGNALMEVCTSGTYQNGYGAERSYHFVSRGLVGGYAYKVKSEKVYNSWKINTQVYATPTPFTQWQILFDPKGGDVSGLKRLRMNMTVAYRRPPQAGS